MRCAKCWVASPDTSTDPASASAGATSLGSPKKAAISGADTANSTASASDSAALIQNIALVCAAVRCGEATTACDRPMSCTIMTKAAMMQVEMASSERG